MNLQKLIEEKTDLGAQIVNNMKLIIVKIILLLRKLKYKIGYMGYYFQNF